MISDVLFDAVKQIERYEAEMPETCNTMREEIQRAKDAMQALQRKLDAPPQYNSFQKAADCLMARLRTGQLCTGSLMEWMMEHDVEPQLVEDMLADSIKELAGDSRETARRWVEQALAALEEECKEEGAQVVN